MQLIKRKNETKDHNFSTFDLLFYNSSMIDSLTNSLEKKLKQAGLPDDPRMYASRIFSFLLISMVIGVILIAFGILMFRDYELTRLTKFAVGGIMLTLFGIIIPPVTYLVLTSNVSQKIENRRITIEAEIPAFSALFLVFLRSGLSPGILFVRLTEASAFVEMSNISKYIVKRIRFLGESVEKAIDESIRVVPSKLYEELMTTYITAIRTGAPVYETIQAKVRDMMKEIELVAFKAADSLSGVGEGYVTWLSSGFITFFLMLILEAVFPQLHVLPLGLLGVFAVIGIPIVNVMFIWVVDQIQFKFPEKKTRANKIFLFMLPVGLVIGIISMIVLEPVISKLTHETPIPANYMILSFFTLSGNIKEVPATALGLSIGLLISLIPPYIIAKRELSAGTGYEIYVARFLRAVGEGIRAGLSPEVVIENLKDSKELGKLQDILKKSSAYVRLGYPLKDAFRRASETIIDFPTRVAFSSLADMIEIGSLTPETVETLADQIEAQIRIRREYYTKIKTLLYMPYIGSVLALITTVMLSSAIISLLSSSSLITSYGPLAIAQVLVPKAVYISAISSVFNALTAGLLVGKLGSGRIANGYIHSALLLLITVMMVLVSVSIKFNFAPPVSPTF